MQHKALQGITTPAYVADIAALKRNMAVAKTVKERTGVKILLATKAFSMFSVFDVFKDTLDGTTASGLFEARMGATHFGGIGSGKEVHCYSPAYTEDELRDVLEYSDHIYFNSVSQLKRFAPMVRARHENATIALRVNPQISLVKNSSLYDPSAPSSRFGVHKEELSEDVLAQIDMLHFHNLCENMAQDSVALIKHVASEFAFAIQHVSKINLGGGHYMTHPDYDLFALCDALVAFQKEHNIAVTLEPGGTFAYEAGYLVSTVLDIVERAGGNHAILDTSASTHMPDVLEVPYRPNIIDSGEKGEKPHSYILGGKTCMTGDVIGEYSFDQKLEIGSRLIFTDMMQYSMVKNTTFNGMPLPDIGILHEDGSYELVKSFGYDDFLNRLS